MNLSKYPSWNISRKQLQYLKIARRPLYVEWWPFFTISCFLFIFQFTNFYFISFISLFIFLHSKKREGGGRGRALTPCYLPPRLTRSLQLLIKEKWKLYITFISFHSMFVFFSSNMAISSFTGFSNFQKFDQVNWGVY